MPQTKKTVKPIKAIPYLLLHIAALAAWYASFIYSLTVDYSSISKIQFTILDFIPFIILLFTIALAFKRLTAIGRSLFWAFILAIPILLLLFHAYLQYWLYIAGACWIIFPLILTFLPDKKNKTDPN